MISTNVWVNIDSFQDLAFNVPDGSDIKVYICDPSETSFLECVEIESVAGTYTGEQPVGTVIFTEGLQCIPFDTIPGGTCATRGEYATSPISSEGFDDAPCSIYTTNANGYKVKWVSGEGPITIVYTSPLGARDQININTVGDHQFVPIDTSYIFIMNPAVSSPATHPFVVEICPPGE